MSVGSTLRSVKIARVVTGSTTGVISELRLTNMDKEILTKDNKS